MLLAIDVGNTNTVIGVAGEGGAWKHVWRFTTPRMPMGSDWAPVIGALAKRDVFDVALVTGVAICSVVPMATSALSEYSWQWLGIEPLVIDSHLSLGITLGMENPREVGTDRIANAVAVWEELRRSVIVVDLGTATKIEAIDVNGAFLGGAIAPGLGLLLDSLTAKAARLFSIPLDFPDSPIGRNTSTALQSGIVLGHLHTIRGLIDDFGLVLGPDVPVVITGGYALGDDSPFAALGVHRPNLTLDGIRLIWNRNQD